MTRHANLHAVDRLRRQCQATSTRHFRARGVALQRCQTCLLGVNTCICPWRRVHSADMDFILIMHRDEVFKPTNTGRLVADIFPDQCRAFLWDRTRPEPGLLDLLQDPRRQCALLFPPSDNADSRTTGTADFADSNLPTLIILDGTWKQASRMARVAWLRHIPRVDLGQALAATPAAGDYGLRRADDGQRLSTAQATGLFLQAANRLAESEILLDYFSVFNEHYLAARMNRKPDHLPAHQRLAGGSQ